MQVLGCEFMSGAGDRSIGSLPRWLVFVVGLGAGLGLAVLALVMPHRQPAEEVALEESAYELYTDLVAQRKAGQRQQGETGR